MSNEEKILQMLSTLTTTVNQMQSQMSENAQILKSLEHNSQEHKSLLDQLNHKVSSVEGKIDTISKDLNFVEVATGKNIVDIAHLKAIK